MDSAVLKRHLEEAEGHVVLGEQHIVRQRQLVFELERDGHDTTVAKQLLAEFEATQVLHAEHRDRLRQQLAELPVLKPPT